MKKVSTLLFGAILALALSMPAWSQSNTGTSNQSKTASTKADKDAKKAEAKAKKDAAKAKKKADKDAKKNESKKK